jgi:hypothetical protein
METSSIAKLLGVEVGPDLDFVIGKDPGLRMVDRIPSRSVGSTLHSISVGSGRPENGTEDVI